MTPLYVLCYVIYKTVTSSILSLLCGLRLLRRALFPPATANEAGNLIALYEGIVRHDRRHPVHNSFRLTSRFALIDLDCPPYSPPTYLSADHARRAAKTNGPVHLLRIPPSVGYEKSPVNYYYCYDMEGSKKIFKKCLVEGVSTPWGESITFVFNPSSDLVPKAEHISPFMDMSGNWRLKAKEPGENLYASISVEHPMFGNIFTATLTAKRIITYSDLEAFFWLMPHKISITAYWNGLKLWWKRAPFYDHPRMKNPAYREEAAARDENIQFCTAFGAAKEARIDRSFMWKDSKWPWRS